MTATREIIAENITALRKSARLTQAELAEKLNYSDKAISKWERGDSVPDVLVLAELAELYGVGCINRCRIILRQVPVIINLVACGICNIDSVTDAVLSNIIEYELVPLLKEYWFDEPIKVKDWSNNLRSAIK